MQLQEHERFVLMEDLPEKGLQAGELGTVVMVHRASENGYTGPDGYHGEFTYLSGGTRAVVGLRPDQVRPVEEDEVAFAKRPAKASA
jgi:hypothetical protein